MAEETKEEARQRVIEQITRAFDGVGREDGISFYEARAIDDYATDALRAEARALDTDTRWQDVPEEDIEHGSLSLNYFDPKGFRYYLPAYMIWSLRNYETTKYATPSSTVRRLQLDDDPDSHECSLPRFRLLNSDQSAAVCAFLRYMEAHSEELADDAHKALNDHWSEFCAGE